MRLLTGEEVTTIYPKVFKDVFGFESDKQTPRNVFLSEDGKGFVSGYLIDKENFYMSWAGHPGGMLPTRKCFFAMEEYLVDAGVKYFIGRIGNRNTVVQRLMLGMGWYPRGLTVSDNGIYIEYIKEL